MLTHLPRRVRHGLRCRSSVRDAYDFYRLWGGDLVDDGNNLSCDKYERANRIKTTGPARHLQLGQLYARLGRNQDANESYRAARTQLSAHLNDQRAANRNPTDAN